MDWSRILSVVFCIAVCVTPGCTSTIQTQRNLSFSPSDTGLPICGPETFLYQSFNIPAHNSKNDIINSLYIVFETDLNTTVASTTYYDSHNAAINFPRKDNWYQYGCSNEPYCNDVYTVPYSGYARGHLTPVCDLRYSKSAMESSFACVNQSPMLHRGLNLGPWSGMELKVSKAAKQLGGFVMTGVCPESSPLFIGSDVFVPDCFWKLHCFKDLLNNNAVVVGFLAKNVAQTGMKLAEVSQKYIQDSIGEFSYLTPTIWNSAFNSLRMNRDYTNAPMFGDCTGALELSNQQILEYNKVVDNAPAQEECEECFCDDIL